MTWLLIAMTMTIVTSGLLLLACAEIRSLHRRLRSVTDALTATRLESMTGSRR